MIFNASNLSPDIFAIGPFVIRWYAMAYVMGFIFGWKYCLALIKGSKERPNANDWDDLLTWLVLGIILGGRLGYVVFYNAPYYLSHPIDILQVWQGGMSFHGGILGVILAGYLFARKHKIKFFRIMDLVAAAGPLGLFFGRLANFINNELWGRSTNGSWGIIFKNAGDMPRHPSQIYEAFLEGLVMLVVLNFVYRKKSDKLGVTSGWFLVMYGAFRIIIEFFREPDVQIGYILGSLTMGQILSLPMIMLGIFLILKKH